MARISGRNGALYAGISSGGTAEPIAFLNSWSLNASTSKDDVTAFGDSNKVYVGGLPDATGQYGGWYDTATPQLYTAALDGVARKVYLYPDRTDTGEYFFGTAFFDFSVDVRVEGGVAISGSFSAATLFPKVAT